MRVGDALASARQGQGRSVEDVSSATRIRPHLIRALEAGDLAACGGDVYARGHIRALARELSLDPEPLLAELPGGPRAAAPTRMPASDASLVLRERRTTPRWTAALAAALGVLACLAALRLVLPVDAGAGPATLRKPVGGAQTRAVRTPPATPTRTPAATARTPGALAVSLAVTGSRCWVTVRDSDGVTRLATMLTQGQTAAFSDDKRLTVVLGDAKAVELSVNGAPVTLRGGTGRLGVKRFDIRADDPLAAFGTERSAPADERRSRAAA